MVFWKMFNGFWLDFGWALEGFCKDFGNVFGPLGRPGGPKDASDVYSFSLAAYWEFKLYWGVLLSFPVLANYRYHIIYVYKGIYFLMRLRFDSKTAKGPVGQTVAVTFAMGSEIH